MPCLASPRGGTCSLRGRSGSYGNVWMLHRYPLERKSLRNPTQDGRPASVMLSGYPLNAAPAECSPLDAPVDIRCSPSLAGTHAGGAEDRFDSILFITYNDAHALTKPGGALGSDRKREAERQ